MTPERMAELVAIWVRLYTRDLPPAVAQRRVDELAADLHDQIAHGRSTGIGDRRIAFAIVSRMLRGLAADAAWRGRQARPAARPSTLEETMKMRKSLSRAAVRVALGVALVLSLPLVATQITNDVVWSAADFALAGVLLATVGVALELAVKKAGNLVTAIGVAALGIAAAVLGEADDAPGLVLLGILLVVSASALGVGAAQRGKS
jgi:hypothetical protein